MTYARISIWLCTVSIIFLYSSIHILSLSVRHSEEVLQSPLYLTQELS